MKGKKDDHLMKPIEFLVEKYDHLINTDVKDDQRPDLSNEHLYLCQEDERIASNRNDT